jgi:hypothetical protein
MAFLSLASSLSPKKASALIQQLVAHSKQRSMLSLNFGSWKRKLRGAEL